MERDLQRRVQDLESQVQQQATTIDWLTEQLQSLKSLLPPHPSISTETKAPPLTVHPDVVSIATTPTEAVQNGYSTPIAPQDVPSEPLAPPKQEVDWEQLLVRTWLPRIFIFVLLLGLLYGFIAASNAGLLTPPVRCFIGIAVGLILLVLGEKQVRAKRTALGQVMLGGSICALMITTFAAHMRYGLIPSAPAFLLLVFLIMAGIFLAERHRSQALAILASFSGCLVPFLVKSDHPNTVFFMTYEVLLVGAFLLLSAVRRYSVLYIFTSVMFHLTSFLYFINVNQDHMVIAIGIGIQHLLLLLLVLSGRLASPQQVATLFTSASLTVAWWFGLLHVEHHKPFLLALLVLAIPYLALFLIYRRDQQVRAPLFFSIATFASMFYLLNLLEGRNSEAIALLIEAGTSLYVAYQLRNVWQKVLGTFLLCLGMLYTLIPPISKVVSMDTLAWLVLLAVLAFLGWLQQRELRQSAVPEAALGLYRFVNIALAALLLIFLTEVTLVLTEHLQRDGQHMAISFLWMFYSLGVILFGFLKQSRYVRLGGIIMLFLTLGKLVLIDLPFVSMMVRALLFVALGVLGLLVSRLFYKKNTR